MLTEAIEGFRLSPQQEYFWLLQKTGDSSKYRSQCAILIEGNLELNTLKQTLQNIINKHEILRTNFCYLPDMTLPVQVINNYQIQFANYYNFSDFHPQEQEIKIEEIIQEISRNNFDFEQGILLHTSLIALSPQRHFLLLNLPGIIADAATIGNLVCELSRSYSACLQGQDLSTQPPLQYADFAEWQNELLEAKETEIGREYWQNQDYSTLENVKLYSEKNHGNQLLFDSQCITSDISSQLTLSIQELIGKYNISIDIFLLACWIILIRRLTQQSNIIVGTAFDGRKYPGLKEALGLFAKYLPIHCELSDNLSFSQVLQQTEVAVNQVSQWQECFNWETIRSVSHEQDELFFCPLCFDFTEAQAKYTDSEISFSIYKQSTCIDRFKTKLSCRVQDDCIIADFYYDSYQFDREDIQRVVEQYHQLVASVIQNPEAAISDLEILSDRALHQLLVEFNQTQAPYPKDKCIHQLIAHQARQTPDNIAVVFDNQQLTYSQLNSRANQLAHYLQQIGVIPGILVGICIERSLDMIIGIIGILKAGGAYVPLDPTYPQARLAWILENSQTPVLLTQQPLLQRLPAHAAHIICLDSDWELITQQSQENPPQQVTPTDLAYIIYTSGSTGKPKGVQITHRNLVHSTSARINYYQQPVSRFLLLSSFAFDSSVAGIFWTLCCGGTLVLPQEGLQRDVVELVELIYQNQITHLLSLPSLYALILQQAKREQLVYLQTIIVAGESCPNELVKRHQEYLSAASLFNEYGPTEGTVWSSIYHCQSQQLTQIPIGRPIANTQIYILDANLRPVPIGVSGEIYIGGDGLALGYLNQPELTAQKFISNLFSHQQPIARLYKTGDLAQYRTDGNIKFLGRVDQQVKIRGYRIELGEIEGVLKQHPAVGEVVVVATEESKQQPQEIKQRLENFIGQENSEILVTQMLSLEQEQAEQLLTDIEKLSEYQVEEFFQNKIPTSSGEEKRILQRLRKFADFDISLQIKSSKFISTPLETQRDRLINVALDEFADDLIHLDELSKRFVPGATSQNDLNQNEQSKAKSYSSQTIFEDQRIMEDWQLPLMKAMANIVTETHGDVLEIGFGRGISANYIQQFGVKSHTIIECDENVVQAFYEWKSLYPDQDIRLIQGKWQDVVEELDIYDGIFFHTNLLNEDEFIEHVVKSITYAEHFFPTAAAHLKEGGIFTYLTNEIDSFSRRHQRLVLKYFSSLNLSVIQPLSIPENTRDLWWADSMVSIKAIK